MLPAEDSNVVIGYLSVTFAVTEQENENTEGSVNLHSTEAMPVGGELKKEEIQRLVELRQGQTVRVGRAEGNDILIPDRKVSRYHAAFSCSKFGVIVCDLSSLNGTFVNGVRLSTPLQLHSGDEVRIGRAVLALRSETLSQSQDLQAASSLTLPVQLASVTVTLLIADVCGYTQLSQLLPPKMVAHMLDLWMSAVTRAVTDWGGEVDKFIGDGVMALWRGNTGEGSDFTYRALQASLGILEETRRLAASSAWPYYDDHNWRCRVVLNSGEALVGTLSWAGKREFAVLGDTVNAAFRLEDAAGRMGEELVFTRQTAQLLSASLDRRNVAMRDIGAITVEGRSGELDLVGLVLPSGIEKARKEHPRLLHSFKQLPIISDILSQLSTSLPLNYYFHNANHSHDVLSEVVFLALAENLTPRQIELLAVAAAYHDSGFLYTVTEHEAKSAEVVRQAMSKAGGYAAEEGELVGQLILDTKLLAGPLGPMQKPNTPISGCLLDADLANLGRSDFMVRFDDLCRERGRNKQQLIAPALALVEQHQWWTATARALYQGAKERNLKLLQDCAGGAK